MNETVSESRAVNALRFVFAFLGACALVYVGAVVADKYDLRFFHGWAMAHGVIFLVFPFYFALCFLLLKPLLGPVHARVLRQDTPVRHVSGLAVASLVLSGLSFLVPFLGSTPGIVLGHLARRRCKANPQLTGSGVALGGLIISYLGLAYSAYVVGAVSFIAATHGS